MKRKSQSKLHSFSSSPNRERKLVQTEKKNDKQMKNLPKEGIKVITTKAKTSRSLQDTEDLSPQPMAMRSNLKEIEELIDKFAKKAFSFILSNTEKFILSNYIDIFIEEKYIQRKKFSLDRYTQKQVLQIIEKEWMQLSEAWRLYKIKLNSCQIGQPDILKEKLINAKFKNLFSEYENRRNVKLDLLFRNLRGFYENLIK